MSDKRHFTVVEKDGKEHGLFVGRSPSSVAKKVVSKLSDGKKVTFALREITQGSKKKVYGPYEGLKKKLKEPRKVGDRVYKYESEVKKLKVKGGGWSWFSNNEPISTIAGGILTGYPYNDVLFWKITKYPKNTNTLPGGGQVGPTSLFTLEFNKSVKSRELKPPTTVPQNADELSVAIYLNYGTEMFFQIYWSVFKVYEMDDDYNRPFPDRFLNLVTSLEIVIKEYRIELNNRIEVVYVGQSLGEQSLGRSEETMDFLNKGYGGYLYSRVEIPLLPSQLAKLPLKIVFPQIGLPRQPVELKEFSQEPSEAFSQ